MEIKDVCCQRLIIKKLDNLSEEYLSWQKPQQSYPSKPQPLQ